MRRRILLWTAVGAVAFLATVVLLAFLTFRPTAFQAKAERALSERLNADVTIERLDVWFFPRIRAMGSGFTLRVRNRPDLCPFITIDRFAMNLSWFAAITHYVDTVHVDGLKVCVPPSEAREGIGEGTNSSGLAQQALDPSKAIIGHLIAQNGELSFAARKSAKGQPFVFPLHDLKMDAVGFDRSIPFHAVLTNPLPKGLVDANGSFGPWRKDDPSRTPVGGTYEFSKADLSTINGIAGMLSSTGRFDGTLDQINVEGKTDTPDFRLDTGGSPVHLETTFRSMVDGTDGTTVLHEVNGRFLNTTIIAKGAITNLPGPGRHDVDLSADVKKGRIEDLLRLGVQPRRVIVAGDVTLQSKVRLPPGPGAASHRLQVDGQFGLAGANFRDARIQKKLDEFSRRAQGKDEDEPASRVVTDLDGSIKILGGVITLRQLSFRVPGAVVQLNGTCQLGSRVLDLQGTLTMDASVSKAVGGFQSIFLKLLDPFFRRQGRRTVVPIKISGTLDEPDFGVDMRRILH